MSTSPPVDLVEAFSGLVDDAAIFPPGNAAMPDAVHGHREHLVSWYSPLVGPFVCSDIRLPELQRALESDLRRSGRPDDREVGVPTPVPLRVSLTITGGAGAVEPALTWLARDDRLALAGLEAALRDEADLAHNAARLTTVLAGALPAESTAYVEMPRLDGAEVPTGWAAALDEVAASGHRVKYRTGGADPDAFPSAPELASLITAVLDRDVEFKLTAGLHRAVRHTAPDTGFEHHGFLNVLLATRASLDGASQDEIVAMLEERAPAVVAEQVRGLGRDRVVSTRRWFRSVGTCSIIEPVDDLVDLDLISKG
jgi:hypothetical protein